MSGIPPSYPAHAGYEGRSFSIASDITGQDGRPVYRNTQTGDYLYFLKEYGDWNFGSTLHGTVVAMHSEGGEGAACPAAAAAGQWRALNRAQNISGTFVVTPSIRVTCGTSPASARRAGTWPFTAGSQNEYEPCTYCAGYAAEQ